MNKKSLFVLLMVSSFVLTGCMNDVSELYEGHAYDTGLFRENYYSTWDDNLVNRVGEVAKTYPVTSINSFQLNNQSDLENPNNLWGNDAYRNVEEEEFYSLVADTPHEHTGYGYGPSNNLSAIDSAFARGFLSRLYDGRVHCDGVTYAQTRVQIDEKGYGTLFPKELSSYRYFALALRGADESNATFFNVNVNIVVKFYVYDHNNSQYIPYVFEMKDFPVMTNSGGATTIIGFYFAGVMGTGSDLDLIRRASGMSVEFSLADVYENYTTDRNDTDEEKEHFALMLYEVLLPKSSWN